ncbi:MAG: Zinc metalloprotease [Candidatus Midichloriaceae bacterium]|jgi:regulator of sigma E protease|nr:Zinc metalloprotease [Candidatus Midichloriaceae bacterium]
MQGFLVGIEYFFWFLVILSIVVFIHEFGHYLFARLNGVRVEVFSIGFGKELLGINDSHGTRWKLSIIPFGGYVKMFGDSDVASSSADLKIDQMSFKDKLVSFHHKELWRKAVIVFAGPAFNYISAILIIVGMLFWYGKPATDPVVSQVAKGSPAAIAGIKPGDKILAIDEAQVITFEELRQSIALNTGTQVSLLVERGKKQINLKATPKLEKVKDAYGNEIQMPILGISATGGKLVKLSFIESVQQGIHETFAISTGMIKGLWQIITGSRSTKELGGPIKIAQYSGQSAQHGFVSILWFIALISINLGLVNLLPLPVLDGGHLAFYAVEAITGKPASEKFKLAVTKISFALLISLMLYVTFNDITGLVK